MIARTSLSGGITAHRLCKNVTLYLNELTSPDATVQSQTPQYPKPLMLMLPWLGSRPQAVTKYCEIYFRTGFDVLVVESEILQRSTAQMGEFVDWKTISHKLNRQGLNERIVKDFLWPRWGLERGKTLLELLQSEPLVTRPLLIHAFSIGGYTFAQLLVHISQDKQLYQAVTNRIKGQVYDSLVVGSLEHMATGLGKTLYPRWESLIVQSSMLYFRIFKHQTVDYFNASIDVFYNTPVKAPALIFFCENDLLSDAPSVEKLVEYWQNRGMDVTAKKWEVSTHAGHLRRHPQEYLSTLNTFLHSLLIVPLKAKM
ncbi:PREDICTED: transmembrane protein 53-like isoform X1 [Poecilia mexicana]|uniref:transmembrane protein 53-like isoform X1 n=1 Tax=Poecilia mexicana TaxID=48701 RepID=UPI00072E7329|nr:PREDICTED: transmembrane protein 53-like isoform X1 [Poecilia mexicana]